MIYFNLPDLGEGLQEAQLSEWYVAEGDQVKQDQPLAAVETAKTIVDLPSPQDGTIEHIYGKVGDIIHVGDPLVEFSSDSTATADTGTVVGEVKTSDRIVKDQPVSISHPTATSIKATPAVRALAARLHVDLALVKPSGKNNTITAEDIHRVNKLIKTAGEMTPLTGVRRTMSITMSQAHSEVVPATISDDADIQVWKQNEDITIRLIRAIGLSCKAEPSLNAWHDSHAVARILHDQVNLGIAVDTEQGLFVPVLTDIANRQATDLRKSLKAIRNAVNTRTIKPEQMRGHTITLSNFGTFAGRYASPVVVPPTVAIVAAGKIRPEPVLEDGQLQQHDKLPLSLTFDHRVVTGGEAARFLAALINDLQSVN
ncbi:MAG: 2-oxo acid dehydrogenase subunit E2 [Gammaproteobacteria bacterium]|nr:2-oxo acid dehydrogenase subunit E2 [Gammaproteobacteria bacterium]